jgi:hypothetical protein
LISIYIKSIKNFKELFPTEIEEITLVFTENDVSDIMDYKNNQMRDNKFEQDLTKRIYRSVQKLITTFLKPPLPFKNGMMSIEQVSNLILKN